MRCVLCNGQLVVVDSRKKVDSPSEIIRRRKCKNCGAKMDSLEKVIDLLPEGSPNGLPVRGLLKPTENSPSDADKAARLTRLKANRRKRVITELRSLAEVINRWCDTNEGKFDFSSTRALNGIASNFQLAMLSAARLEEN